MINIICEVSKYLVLLFMVLYTVKCFSVLSSKNEEQKRKKLNKQIGYVFVIHFLCYLILYLRLGQLKILIFYVAQIFVAILYMVLYHSIYKDSSRLLTNNASFLLLIGYIMLTRLNFNLAVKQFIFATVGLIITAFIPYIMLKWKKMKDCGVLYGVIGLLFLLTVFIPGLGSEKYGSRNWINLGHLSVQPMEFVKITDKSVIRINIGWLCKGIQRTVSKQLDSKGDFLCFRLVLFQKLRTKILQGRNSTGISSLLIVSVNTCRTTVDDRFLLCSEVCTADKLFAKGHNELGFQDNRVSSVARGSFSRPL